ncbi:MAG TPA: hypothetical protein VID27_09415 [Blastocatellia bacterium]|jgi:hypothetical protein
MKQEKVLGLLILSEFALSILYAVVDFAFDSSLPSSLRAYLTNDAAATTRFTDALMTALWVVVAASTILAWIGLLNLLRAARPLYLASWAAYLILLLLSGPVVSNQAGYAVQMMMALAGGAIVGVIYFSDLSAKFRSLSEAFGPAAENNVQP